MNNSKIVAPAQIDCGNSSHEVNVTINNAADATAVANSCPVVWGNVYLQPGSSGDINLDGIINITGNLRPTEDYGQYVGTNITSFSSSTLLHLGGDLSVYNANQLLTFAFPNLQHVFYAVFISSADILTTIDISSVPTAGNWFRINDVPTLATFKYLATIDGQSDAGIGFTRTGLTRLDGFTSSPGAFYATGSPFLAEINAQISGTTCSVTSNATWDQTGAVVFTENSGAVNVSLPNLVSTAGLLWIDNCSALAIPSLNSVNGSFTMNNASFTSLEAPNLGSINGDLNITGSFTG